MIDGNLVVQFNEDLLRAAHMDGDTEVEVSTDGESITLTPLRESKQTTKLKAIDLAAFAKK